MIGMPSQSSLKTPGVMAAAKLASWPRSREERHLAAGDLGRHAGAHWEYEKLSGLTPLRPGGTRA